MSNSTTGTYTGMVITNIFILTFSLAPSQSFELLHSTRKRISVTYVEGSGGIHQES